ncbi:helix-turn-helix domain-containing protein [Curtobacterium pusillum]
MTAADIRRARELHSRGNSLNAIGRMIGRDPKTVKRSVLPDPPKAT